MPLSFAAFLPSAVAGCFSLESLAARRLSVSMLTITSCGVGLGFHVAAVRVLCDSLSFLA